MSDDAELIVLYENDRWQQPLFDVLDRRGMPYGKIDLKRGAIAPDSRNGALLYFNQASPSAYVRGNTRAVPFALALIEDLEAQGARVINGSKAFRIELSKMAQIGLLRRLGIPHPRTWAFNDVSSLRQRASDAVFPALLKPNQGGSGARMRKVESFDQVEELLQAEPELWLPDHLLLLQEYLVHDDRGQGIVRMEFLGGELLYAIRVISRGNFNLCPSEECNPTDATEASPTFVPYPEVPAEAVSQGRRLFQAAGLDVGAVEYLETAEGRRYFYDLNANSNLRSTIGEHFGFDPFERVADYLASQLRPLRVLA